MDNRKVFSISKHSILNIIIDILVVYCLFKMVTGITTGTEQIYETQRSMYLWRGIMYFSFALFLNAKVNYKNYWLWIFAFIYYSITYYFLYKAGYKVNSPTLWAWYTCLWNSVGVVGLVFFDALFKKRIHRISDMDLVITTLLWISGIGMVVVKNFRLNDTAILGIILILSTIVIDETEIQRLLYGYLVAYYAAFIKTFFESISKIPYNGQERYYGTFTNNGLFGAFAGGATICCIAIGYIFYKKGGIFRKVGVLLSIIMGIPTVAAVSIISARVAMLGLMMAIVAFAVIISVRSGRRKATRKVILGFVLFFFVISILMFSFYKSVPRIAIETLNNNHRYIGSTLLFWHDRIARFYVTESLSGIIPKGSFWNGVDLFTGWRLSYWLEYIKKINAFGHQSFLYTVVYNGEELILSHPHNTMLGFTYLYGVIFGGMFVVMLITSCRKLIRMVAQKKDNNCEMIVFLWMTYCFGIYINEDFMLNYFPTFILLIMQNFVMLKRKTNYLSERIN